MSTDKSNRKRVSKRTVESMMRRFEAEQRRWQNAANDYVMRCKMLADIASTMLTARAHDEEFMTAYHSNPRPFSESVVTLERHLYTTAPSRAEYLDPSTLKARMKEGAVYICETSRRAYSISPRGPSSKWQNHRRDRAMRTGTIAKIFAHLLSLKCPSRAFEASTLASLARKVEYSLYLHAPSLEAYADPSTLEERSDSVLWESVKFAQRIEEHIVLPVPKRQKQS